MKNLIYFFLISYSCYSQEYFSYSKEKYFEEEQYSKMISFHPHLQDVNIFKLKYISFDNLEIGGFMILPKKIKHAPVVIINRGGNGNFGIVTQQMIVRHLARLASNGFIVIGSHLRGNEESEGVDEFGGKDINDVLSLFNIIDELENANHNEIYQLGWSRGGITNFQLLKKSNRIKKTINIAIPSNILNTTRPEMFRVYRNRVPNYQKDSIHFSKIISPISQIDSIVNKNSEIYFIHGTEDKQVNLCNSYELYEQVQKRGYNTDLFIIEKGEHNMFNMDILWKKILEWLE